MNHEVPPKVAMIGEIFSDLADDKERYATLMFLMLILFSEEKHAKNANERIDYLSQSVKEMLNIFANVSNDPSLDILNTKGNA